ncbi:exosome component 10, putative [Cryptosporidium muris RN66]|uniref:Exosome component 10, putative n=1 Tax=Cryptosporidium muris (strain RN66) TaxID=441375 RepID=B6AIJ4_CRYMR|nr:exosome component 10, putative [Cryptosporidium muris RN66]EEA08035.1 exosome component 10, putative [Cryptosporidium muris RN66]|eukprot:XP_002142384.1 exosome component 10 [Cryptosporidium muris RN66]
MSRSNNSTSEVDGFNIRDSNKIIYSINKEISNNTDFLKVQIESEMLGNSIESDGCLFEGNNLNVSPLIDQSNLDKTKGYIDNMIHSNFLEQKITNKSNFETNMNLSNNIEEQNLSVNFLNEEKTNNAHKIDKENLEQKGFPNTQIKRRKINFCNCSMIENNCINFLSEDEKRNMIQKKWSNLIDNFRFEFDPMIRIPQKYLADEVKKFRLENNYGTSKDNLNKEDMMNQNDSNKGIDTPKHKSLHCIHPSYYLSIDIVGELTSFPCNKTGILLVDEIIKLLQEKQVLTCIEYTFPKPSKGNPFKNELKYLSWSINGTIYRAGEEEFLEQELGSAISYKEKSLCYFDFQFSKPKMYIPLSNTPLIYIDDLDGLNSMIIDINNQLELQYSESSEYSSKDPFVLAIDLEHHSMQTFRGFVCLIQMSTRTCDYIIDPFPLFEELSRLNELTTNPRILKLFHGSDYDIIWLQRDFSVYVVNMFDTGQAARVLNTPGGYSLGNLLNLYCSVEANKQYQLSDWRERPLPQHLIEYARSDTHYLPYIYDIMKNQLLLLGNKSHGLFISLKDPFMDLSVSDNTNLFINQNKNITIESNSQLLEIGNFDKSETERYSIDKYNLDPSALLTVMHKTRLICLKEYIEQPIDIWNISLNIISKFSKNLLHNSINKATITLLVYVLILWRETVARLYDISNSYVLKDGILQRLIQKQPLNWNDLIATFPNNPAQIKRHSDTLLKLILLVKQHIQTKTEKQIEEMNEIFTSIYDSIPLNKTPYSNNDYSKKYINFKISNIETSKGELEKLDEYSKDNDIKLYEEDQDKIFNIVNILNNQSDPFADSLFGKVSTSSLLNIKLVNSIRYNMKDLLCGKKSEIEAFKSSNDLLTKCHNKHVIDNSTKSDTTNKEYNEIHPDNIDNNEDNITQSNKNKNILNNKFQSIKEKYKTDNVNKLNKKFRSDNIQNNDIKVIKNEKFEHSNNSKDRLNTMKFSLINVFGDSIKSILPASLTKNIPSYVQNPNVYSPKPNKSISSMKPKKWSRK